MTDLLTLTWASDNEADQDTLNLLGFISGLELANNGWIPQIAPIGAQEVTETLTFYSRALSHDALAARLQLLDDWITRINVSRDPTQRRVVWLNARWKSETNTRRAVVFGLSYSINASPFGPFLRDDSFASDVTIVIRRGAFWEELTQHAVTTQTDSTAFVSNIGGAAVFVDGVDYTAITVSGDVPARIAKAELWHTFQDSDLWVGFRTSRYGNPSLFVPRWEAENGQEVDADTAETADAGASGGFAMVTSFDNDESLIRRVNIITANAIGDVNNSDNQRGWFTVLARAKMSDGVARARISSGLALADLSSRIAKTNARVVISSAAYTLYDMGTIQIPAMPQRFESDVTVAGASGILWDAERVSGTGSLSLDCFILIPITEGAVSMLFENPTDIYGILRANPDDSLYGYDNSFVSAVPDISPLDWSLPANNESPLAVMASQGATSVIATSARCVISYIRRWRTLRGAE